MVQFFKFLVNPPFMPHGTCFLWQPGILWGSVISDGFIALAYFSIPLILYHFVKKRPDLPFHGIFVMFILFILACGATHVMEIYVIWRPNYALEDLIKAATAIISCATAIGLVRVMPKALQLKSPAALAAINRQLEDEIRVRRRAESEARESSERFRQLVDSVRDYAIFLLNADGTIASWNEGASRIYGFSESEAINRHFSILYNHDPDAAAKAKRELVTVRTDGRFEVIENRRRRNGEHYWAHIIITPLHDANGNVSGYTKITRDITSTKTAEEGLRQTKQELEFRVIQRTEALADANLALKREIEIREKVEREVRRLNADLEQRINELQTLFEVLPIGIAISQDPRCLNIRGNKAFTRMLGIGEHANASKTASNNDDARKFQIFHRGRELTAEELPMQRSAIDRREIRDFEEEIHHENGKKLHLLGYAAPLYDDIGAIRGSVGALVDITPRKHAEERLRASLKEKDVLLQEVHHRVKNNLQLVSSLLQLQSRSIQDPSVQLLFRESQERIRSMAMVHEKLYQTEDLANIDFSEYIKNLSEILLKSYGGGSGNIQMEVQSLPLSLGVDMAIPLGLIINELISNSLKHAFPGNRAGKITVTLSSQDAGTYQLSVRDNGIGAGNPLGATERTSLGLRLIKILVEQIDGRIFYREDAGSVFSIEFTASATANRAKITA